MKVQIENHNGWLRLRWNDGNKRQTLAIGLPDSPINRQAALKKKKKIEDDWANGDYDSTLVKYRSQTLGKNATEILAPELFQCFADYQLKHKGLSVSSIESRYKPIVRMLENNFNQPAHQIGKYQVDNFAAICQKSFSGQTSKERCWLLQSCWEWAKGKCQVDPDNPWVGISSRFRLDRRKYQPRSPWLHKNR